jgi:hypothetical protein
MLVRAYWNGFLNLNFHTIIHADTKMELQGKSFQVLKFKKCIKHNCNGKKLLKGMHIRGRGGKKRVRTEILSFLTFRDHVLSFEQINPAKSLEV